jgi:signal peptidase II
MRSVSRVLVVALTLFGCIGCDQASKSVARTFLGSGITESFLHGLLRLQLVDNSGAFLSLGASLSVHLRFALFTVAVGALLSGLVWAVLFARWLDSWRIVALALVAGGGISNLIDRLTDNGRVTDFLNAGIGSLRTGIFNLADMAILAGALLFLLAPRPDASNVHKTFF